MLTLFRWLLRLTVGLILLSVAVIGLVWYFAVRSLPDYDATHRAADLSAPVEIVRTTENVPHILAQTDEDAFFALGFAHAQDRLFQMVVMRRAAQGRLAEIYGPQAFASDDLVRRLGIARHAAASVEAQDARTRAALDAYASGVNRWIEIVNENALGRGAPEFFLFPDEITYWEPADSLAILKLVALGASRQMRDEVMRARLSLAYPARGPEIMGGGDAPTLPGYGSLFPGARFPSLSERHPMPALTDRLEGFIAPMQGASGNSFAADAARSAAGGALLASDPQNPLTAPALWYLARMDLGGRGVIGATIPGIPAILTGRSTDLAWGISPANIDDMDLAIEEVQPGDSDAYRSPAGWVPFTVRNEIIRIRDMAPQSLTLRETEHGAVIPGGHFGIGAVVPSGHVAALRWTGESDEDTTLSALVGLMLAPDRQAGIAAAQGIVAPAVGIALADAGGIAQIQAGLAPVRDPGHATGGRMPAPGWVVENRWTGTRQLAKDGAQTDPANGLVAMTGIVPPSLGRDSDSPLRKERLDQLLQSREIHTRDSFISTQLDIVSPAARRLLPLVGADLWFTGEPAAPGTPERQRQDALQLLAEWDGSMAVHLPEPLIYSAWMQALQARLIRDEIGPLADDITELYPGFIEAVFRDLGGAGRWCDVIQSAPVEDCLTVARQSLDAAIVELTARFGPDVTSWRWGDVHQTKQLHPGLGQLPGIGWIVNLVQPVAGGSFTLARSASLGSGPNPWQAVTGAGYRGVYDLADPDSSVFVISSGQSGHFLSRHYDDMSELWRRDEYVGMSLDPELARAGALGVTRLLPLGAPQ